MTEASDCVVGLVDDTAREDVVLLGDEPLDAKPDNTSLVDGNVCDDIPPVFTEYPFVLI